MRLPAPHDYPKELLIKDTWWKIEFVSYIKNSKGKKTKDYGECCNETKIIKIKKGLNYCDHLYTFCHELVHSFEYEYDFELTEKQVEKLEHAIANLILCNFSLFKIMFGAINKG